jgi:hypothetical protein
MTDREQWSLLRRWTRELVGENSRLQEEVAHLSRENDALIDSNVNLQIERDAADALLGAAMDAGLEVRP